MKTVREVMSTDIISISLQSSIKDALGAMLAHKVLLLPVVDNGELRGVVSDRDIREYALPPTSEVASDSRDHHARLDSGVYAIMDEDVATITPGASVVEAIDLLLTRSVGVLPVVDTESNGKLCGILSYVDILRVAKELF